MLAPAAAFSLFLAVLAGTLLFSVRANGYAANGLFLAKIAFVTIGTVAALSLRIKGGRLITCSQVKIPI
ncbi:MAG: hypothetical protein AB7O39_12715 [Flavobacteriaceae bacterium]